MLVQEGDLDAGFAALESAVWAVPADFGLVGVAANALVAQHAGTPDLTVDVSGGGLIYDQLGRRINIVALQNVNVAVDTAGASTTVAGAPNEKWVSVFARYKKVLSDPRVDGNSDTVFFVEDEGFEFVVMQGVEAVIGAAVRPALLSDGILLADIQRLNGQTQVLTATHISGSVGSGLFATTRRQDAFVMTAGLLSVRAGTPEASDAALLTLINGLVGGSVAYAGGSAWFDAVTNPATTVELQFDKIITDLIGVAGGGGADKLGCGARTTWLGGRTNASGSIFAAIDKIITDLAATGAADDGAERVGLAARSNWLGGRTNPAADVWAGIEKIITDLAATTASDDGSERIGATAVSGFAAGSVRSQLTELGPAVAGTAFTAAKTFNGAAGDTNASLLYSGAITTRKLIWQSTGGASGGKIRVYAAGTSEGTYELTVNALWGGATWSADDTGNPSVRYTFGTGGLGIGTRAAGAGTWSVFTGGWNVIASATNLATLDGAGVSGAIGAQDGVVGISCYASAGGQVIGAAATFRAKFGTAPTSVTYVNTGMPADVNVTTAFAQAQTAFRQAGLFVTGTSTAAGAVTHARNYSVS